MKAKEYRKKARQYLKGNWSTAILSAFLYTLIILVISKLGTLSKENIFIKCISIGFTVIYWIVMPVLSRGLREVYYRLKKGEKVSPFAFLKFGLKSFKRFWGLTGNTLLKLKWYIISILILFVMLFFFIFGATIFSENIAIYSIDSHISYLSSVGYVGLIYIAVLIIVAIFILYIFAIIKNLYYVLTTYIGLDNHNLKTKEAVDKSQELMEGRRGKYVCLMLSFLGWYILAFLVGGLLKRLLPNVFLLTDLISVLGTVIINPYMNMSTIAFYENIIKDVSNKKIKK